MSDGSFGLFGSLKWGNKPKNWNLGRKGLSEYKWLPQDNWCGQCWSTIKVNNVVWWCSCWFL